MSLASPSPSGSAELRTGQLLLQMVSALMPVPMSWLYVAMGVGCAMVVHSEIDLCRERQKWLARTQGIGATIDEEGGQCWISRFSPWCPSSSASKDRRHRRPVTDRCGCSKRADEYCVVRAVRGCLNHHKSHQALRTQDSDVWLTAAPTTFDSLPSRSSSSSTAQTNNPAEEEQDPDEVVASTVLPEASQLSTAMDHLRLKFDSLMVWSRSMSSPETRR